MKIGNIDTNDEILIIAEIGNNHEGDLNLAKRMIKEATDAGAKAVKFQMIVPDKLVAKTNTERIKQLERFCLSDDDFIQLAEIARKLGIMFLATPYDKTSAKFLEPLQPAYKISSGDNNFLPLIEAVAKTGKPIILSSGLTNLEQIARTKAYIEQIWVKNKVHQEMALLHCVSSYPTPDNEANLLAIKHLQTLGTTVGYSDHTIGIEAAILAVALGARIIEKHFTLNKSHSDFRDHKLSSDPKEMAELVKRVKKTVEMLGDGRKKIMNNEFENVTKMRRFATASKTLGKGSTLKEKDIGWVRCDGHYSPEDWPKISGKKIRRGITAGNAIRKEDIID